MDSLNLAIERPVLLSPESRRKLENARKRIRHDYQVEATEGVEPDAKEEILERAYEDISQSIRPEQPPLSFRLRKLWSERGDFSKFRASTLVTNDDKEEVDEIKDGDQWDLGANLSGLLEVEEPKDGEKQDKSVDLEGVRKDGNDQEGNKDVMSIQDMLQLRSKMMDQLGLAQNSLFFSHAMISLLINSTKADQASTSNPSAARAGSPTSNSAGGALRGDTAASTSAIQRNANALHVMGSAANLEAELGIEPQVFGATRLEAERKEVEPRGGGEDEGDEDDDIDQDEDEEDLNREAIMRRKEDKKLSEVEKDEKARDLVDCYQGKKQGIGRAAEILRRGASALRGNEERNKKEEMRWQLLLQAKRTGWGLVPDKPIRGTSKKKRELLEDGNRKRDEPARDAWIGYAVPEAHIVYRRRALAYFSHDSGTSFTSPAEALAFASRSKKRLRVSFVIGEEVWSSGTKEKDDGGMIQSTEEQLRSAQQELADAELFDGVVAECRAMGSSSSLFPATINNEDSVSISLNGTTLIIEMVEAKEIEESPKDIRHSSALASSVVSILRLGLIRQYRVRAGVSDLQERKIPKGKDEGVRIPLLLPILGSIHYMSFITRLRTTLENVRRSDPLKNYELKGLEKIRDGRRWLSVLLQGANDAGSIQAMESLGGSATLYIAAEPVAYLTISYPSSLSLSLPKKKNAVGGRGVHLSRVDIRVLEALLNEELQ